MHWPVPAGPPAIQLSQPCLRTRFEARELPGKKAFSLAFPPLFRRTIDYETGETASEEIAAFEVDGQSLYVTKENEVLIN